jgi:hypothetical protein
MAPRGQITCLSALGGIQSLRDNEHATCFERGDVAGAARHYREILQLFPDDPVAVMLRDLPRNLQPDTLAQGIEE